MLPFYPGLAHRLRRVFRRAGVRVAFKSSAPLRNIISRRKPDSFPKKGLVYQIPCSQCDWSYIGETGRTLKDRLSEHRRAVRNLSTFSEISNHVLNSGHVMNWEGAKVLTFEGNHMKRLFKESWFSRTHNNGNRVFYDLDNAWDSLL